MELVQLTDDQLLGTSGTWKMDQTQLVTSVGSKIWEVGDVVVNKLHFIHFHLIAMHFLNFSDTHLKCISGLHFLAPPRPCHSELEWWFWLSIAFHSFQVSRLWWERAGGACSPWIIGCIAIYIWQYSQQIDNPQNSFCNLSICMRWSMQRRARMFFFQFCI